MRAQTAVDVLQHVPMATTLAIKGCQAQPDATPWPVLLATAAAAYGTTAAAVYGTKHLVSERRPDKSDRRSFPSGHAALAFAGAGMLWHEYGRSHPWVAVGGYGVAVAAAISRVDQRRHYVHDVCAGAALGAAATELAYLLRRRLLKNRQVSVAFSGQTLDLAITW